MNFAISFSDEAKAAIEPILSMAEAETIVRREVEAVLEHMEELPPWGLHCISIDDDVEIIAGFNGELGLVEVDLVSEFEEIGPFEAVKDISGTDGFVSLPIPAASKTKPA